MHHLNPKESKISDDEKSPMEFSDMCDNVIDIILGKLELDDLANISDTNKRLRGIAASVFSRKYGNHLLSIDAFVHNLDLSESMIGHYKRFEPCIKNIPTIRISNAKIWFKLLRNFGDCLRFLRIDCGFNFNPSELNVKIPNAFKNLTVYILEYCTDSLEKLETHDYPLFYLNKPWNKLDELYENCSKREIENPNTQALELMPNLKSLNLSYAPESLQNHFPKLECVKIDVHSVGEVHSFISFLRLNRQITCLDIWTIGQRDLIYSAIEENLKQLRVWIIRGIKTPEMESVRTYQFKTVKEFSMDLSLWTTADNCLQFDNLKKLEVLDMCRSKWNQFILRNKKLKIFEANLVREKWFNRNGAVFIRQLIELPELEQIIFGNEAITTLTTLKTILGQEWEQILLEEKMWDVGRGHNPKRFKAIFQRRSP